MPSRGGTKGVLARPFTLNAGCSTCYRYPSPVPSGKIIACFGNMALLPRPKAMSKCCGFGGCVSVLAGVCICARLSVPIPFASQDGNATRGRYAPCATGG